MRVLALEPFHGGSHAAFLDGWRRHSHLDITALTLPAHHWKWRMRHAAVTLADRAADLLAQGAPAFDALWCSDMLDLAAFRGLAPAELADLPAIAYFHENQLTYPVREGRPRDQHFGFTNLTTALAAIRCGGAVWWNTAYNRDSFLHALDTMLQQTPKPRMAGLVERIRKHSHIVPPGIDPIGAGDRPHDPTQPLHILWAARWEHDKNPQAFFAAIDRLHAAGAPFRLSVIGESFDDTPEVFPQARQRLAKHIVHWGYQPTRPAYEAVLREADVIVSTADHEFFGLSIVEAISAGCYPILPRRLAYPQLIDDPGCFYDGTPTGLAERLREIALDRPAMGAPSIEEFAWDRIAPMMDQMIQQLLT